MASDAGFVQYVADQLSGAGEVRCRKMFGEYGLYLNGKFFALICDDRFFVKDTPEGRAAAPELPLAPPYKGARPCLLVEDVDDRELLIRLAQATWAALPEPAPKKKKKEGGKDGL